ncbi:hypothetical protein ACWDSJ_06880 [Nocardia sp. NPDC003482]
MERKTFLQVLTGSVTVLALGGVETHERLIRAIDDPSRVDAALIEHLDRICDYCRRQDDIQGAQAVLALTRAQLSLVHAMGADCPTRLRPELLAVFGKFAGLAGWLSLDSRQLYNAWRYFEIAHAAAEEAGAPALVGFTLARMSHVAKAQNRIDLATTYAAAAVRAAQRAEPLVRTFTYDQLARAHAKAGDETECVAALELARTTYDRAKNADTPPNSSLAYFYDDGFLPHTESQCYLNLNRPDVAVERAEQALALHDPNMVRDNAFSALYLATTYVRSDQPEPPVNALMSAASSARQNRSVQLAERIQTVRASMGCWNGSPLLTELDGYLREQHTT